MDNHQQDPSSYRHHNGRKFTRKRSPNENARKQQQKFSGKPTDSAPVKILLKSNNVTQQNDQPTKQVLLKVPTMTFEKSVRTSETFNGDKDHRPQRMKLATKMVSHIIQSELQLNNHQNLSPTSNIPLKLVEKDLVFGDMNQLESILLTSPAEPCAIASTSVSAPVTTPSGESFCTVGIIGLEGVGKSSLLNRIAGAEVFPVHGQRIPTSFGHLTNGVDFHITSERVFLLDTLPLLSASVLDNLLQNDLSPAHTTDRGSTSTGLAPTASYNAGSTLGFEVHEPDNLAFIYSLQLATFLFAICDHVVLVLDHFSLDAYLLKLLATALVMVGETTPKANLIVHNRRDCFERTQCRRLEDFDYAANSKMGLMFMDNNNIDGSVIVDKMIMQQYQQQYQDTVQTIIGTAVSIDFIEDEARLLKTVLTPPSRQLIGEGLVISYASEKAWLQSVHKYWQGSIKKTTLFSDYARCLP